MNLTLFGPPNEGKSSIINSLAKRDVAIVAETAVTTRDVIEVRLDLAGYPVIVADTAGLREAAEAVEAEGVRRALARAEQADLVLLLLDGGQSNLGVSRETFSRADLVVWNKADLAWPQPREGLRLSLKSGEGLTELIGQLARLARVRLDRPREEAPLSRTRPRHALVEAHQRLGRAMNAASPELLAEDLRLAARA